jgi:septal ring factor EnvC (AmiA/AmiB activator)
MRLSGWAKVTMVAAVVLVLGTDPAMASNRRDPNKEAIRRMQMQVKQAEDDKAAAEQAKADLQKQLDAEKKKSTEVESSLAHISRAKSAAEKAVDTLKREKTNLSESLAKVEQQLAETKKELHDTTGNLHQVSDQKQRLEQDLTRRNDELTSCEGKNKKLYQYEVELVNRAQQQGSLDVILEKEPLVGFKRVEIENLMEEYRDKIDKDQVIPSPK